MPPAQLKGNTAPTLGGALAGQTINDNAAISPFATLTVTDPDHQVMTVIVTIGNGVERGKFTAASSAGWTRTTSGSDIVYSRTFPSAADIGTVAQAAVRALRFRPRTNAIAPGFTETTSFSVLLNDGIAAPAVDDTTSVVRRSEWHTRYIGHR